MAKSNIKINQQLLKALQGEIDKKAKAIAKQRLREASKKVEQIMVDCIYKYFYEAYTPKVYKRTYALLNSVTTKEIVPTKTGYMVSIVLDDSKWTSYKHRFYVVEDVNDDGTIYRYKRIPRTAGQETPAFDVFHLASEGIHGLPKTSNQYPNWVNYSFRQTTPTFAEKINEYLDRYHTELIMQFADALRHNGFNVKYK